MTRLSLGATTHVGLRRKRNEDSFLAESSSNLLVLCDGMGGHQAGNVASRLAVQIIRNRAEAAGIVNRPEAEAESAALVLKRCILSAHDEILELSREMNQIKRMGTTALAALLLERDVAVAAVGDGRAYLLGTDGCRQVTRTHTVAERYAELGLIPRARIQTHPLRHVLLSAVGSPDGCRVDAMTLPMGPDDSLLLASDGLWDMVDETAALDAAAAGAQAPQSVTDKLASMALEGGGHDNVTVLMARRPKSNDVTSPSVSNGRAATCS